MHVTFVAIGWEQLNLSLLSAIAKREGHEVSLAFSPALFDDRYNLNIPWLAKLFDDRRDLMRTVTRQQPDILAFSPVTGSYQWMLGVAAEAKALLPGVKTVFGGVHASAVPEQVLRQPQVDYVCVGEGDEAFPRILKAVAQGDFSSPLPNTRYRDKRGQIIRGPQAAFVRDLDALPAFDKTLWEDVIRIGDLYFTMASRGCPLRCTYCFNSFFAKTPGQNPGPYVRHRSVGHVLQELRLAKQRYRMKLIEFEDDIFTCNKKWLKDFLLLYKKEIGIPFQCLSHPSFMDEDVIRWLAEAGCRFVQMGIQSLDDVAKKQTMKRTEKAYQVEQVMQNMRKYGVALKVDHMFGLPQESLSALEKARDLYLRMPPYRIQTFWMTYFPGTEILKQAQTTGMMTAADVLGIESGQDNTFYHNSTRFITPEKQRIYWAYESIFKLIPLLPLAVSRRLSPQFFERLPKPLNAAISFTADILCGLVKRNPDHWGYARYYLYHIFRFCCLRLGIRPPPATRARTQ